MGDEIKSQDPCTQPTLRDHAHTQTEQSHPPAYQGAALWQLKPRDKASDQTHACGDCQYEYIGHDASIETIYDDKPKSGGSRDNARHEHALK
jgi:hypothetical protein